MHIKVKLLPTIVITTLALPFSMIGGTTAVTSVEAVAGMFDDRPAAAHRVSPVGPQIRIGILDPD